jgi:Tfp pilus assembly protein PilF
LVHNPKAYKRQVRRTFAVALTSVALYSGCASMPGPATWFSKKSSDAALNGSTQSSGTLASSLSNASQGIGGQVKSMGTTMASAMGKAKTIVTSPFAPKSDNSDPTSLANMPTNLGPEIWVTNGQLYEGQGKHAKAMENYTKALQVEPNNEAALLSIARLHARQQQYPEAERYFNQALALRPQADVYNDLATLLLKQGRSPEAFGIVEKAIALEPNSQRYRNNLASMLVSAGRSDEAVQQLSTVFPPAIASYNVAYLHFAKQDIAGAQQHLQVALQADPNLKEARDLWATINNNPAAQSAVAAYQTANQIYRTAQTAVTPTTVANQAVFQQAAAGQPTAQAASFPQP